MTPIRQLFQCVFCLLGIELNTRPFLGYSLAYKKMSIFRDYEPCTGMISDIHPRRTIFNVNSTTLQTTSCHMEMFDFVTNESVAWIDAMIARILLLGVQIIEVLWYLLSRQKCVIILSYCLSGLWYDDAIRYNPDDYQYYCAFASDDVNLLWWLMTTAWWTKMMKCCCKCYRNVIYALTRQL